MADKNPDFKTIILHDVELVYPRLDQPHHFDQDEDKTVPCAPRAKGAAWSVGIKLPMDRAKKLSQELAEHYNSRAAENSKLTKYSGTFGTIVKEEDGYVIFTPKQNCTNKDGDLKNPPVVLGVNANGDRYHLDGAAKKFWSGSKGNVKMSAFPTKNPRSDEYGISLNLQAVVVTEAVYGSGEDDGFTATADAPAAQQQADDGFSASPESAPQASYDDEPPF